EPGQKRLAAYVVPQEGAQLQTAELRARLAERLPEYMVPAAFVTLERLPLNANGKVDRRALPQPQSTALDAYTAPRTPAEEVLAGIWAEVLKSERVGALDNFFELGGHSLLATQVISRVRAAFGVEVPLKALFEAPTVAGLAGRIEALRGDGALLAPPMVPVPRDGSPLPLSFAQQRLWLVDRIEPDSAAYNMPSPLRLRGALELPVLRASLDALVRRHESLRTTFSEEGGRPVQVVHPPRPVPLPMVDLRGLPDPARQVEAKRLSGAEAVRPFDLARGPLLRGTLVRLDEEDHVLLFNLHHIVSDGWSMQVLVREVSVFYAAFARGEPADLPELPVQYADFAVWQREWLSGEVLEAQIGFWKERLGGAPPLLEIPTDRPRRAGQSPLAASHPFALSPELSRRLRELARREGATLFMTLLAGWQALLSRYSGQDDVVVGTPIAGRNRRETEGLIGFFVNTLALRARLAADPTWSGLLEQVREETLGAYDHQDLPFERLVEELGVERSLTHTPVFQAMFTLDLFDGGGGEKLELGELGPERFGGGGGVAKFDLDLVFSDGGEGLGAGLLYRRTLFDAATVARMVGHLEAVLEGMAADPRQRLSELSLLNAAERVQLLEASGTAPLELPPTYVQEMISAQAVRAPGAPAVVFGGEALTYGELESAANRLAHHLRLHGVGPEARVGICLERSPRMVVGVLGVLKAGGAYVPLDPSHPAERLAYVMKDAALSVLLTREGLLGSLPPHGARAVCLDRDAAEIARQSGAAPESGLQPENLAYVIYTSGSTGRPKGVEVVHGGVSNYLGWAAAAYAGQGHGAPVHSSLTFDLTVTSLLVPLARGEKVVLTDEAEGVEGLARALREEPGFTLVKLTPAHLGLLAEQLTEAEAAAAARTLVVGGEALPAEVAAYWRRVAPETALVNEYGPTETVVGCSVYRVPDPGVRGSVPIGRPIAGTQLYVLGGEMQLVPAGMPGELYVGGAGVARGYLGRPGLTAEKFVPDAAGGRAGARLYRTGDRARWRMDGELEFLGRVDQQVKIRGFRIEPGEIEAVLLEHPGVGEATVAVREDVPGDRRLAAYVVPREGAQLSTAELRARLAERLPEYMVPSAFVVLDRLPLTPNGKVDRRALPAPGRGTVLDAYTAPRTPAEEVLAGIWAEVLKTERVGALDNFFELGGHSLLATQVVSRLRDAFGVEVPLKALFEAPTVAGLAGRIEALRGDGTLLAPPIVPVPRDGSPLPLSFAQQRLWLVDRIEPDSAAYNMPSPLRLRGALELRVLRASLDALVRRHESLRTVFPEEGGRPAQVVRPAGRVPLPMVDLRGLPEEARQAEAKRLSGAEAMRPFDLARGPLLRSTLVRLDEEDHVLLFNLHHIVSDGWSMQVLVREVSTFYAAFARGEPADLPELPVQYADFAVWQREWLSGEVLQAQIGFWRERLEGAPPLLEVPTDRPRRAGQSPLAASHPFALSSELSQRLRELARREGATLFMTLLAGWQALLSRYSGQDDVVVGTPIAGRNRRETEGLIGFFVNTLALRARLAADPTWSGLLEQVREETLGAYDHQDLPFERLVEELGVERSLTHTPVFQTMFTLNLFGGGSGEKLELGELGPERFGGGGGVAKFDLDLVFSDGGETLGAGLLYRRALFEAATIARMAGHLQTVLEALAADPARHLSELSLLRGEERAQVLEAWNDTAAAYPRERCIHELFAEQAARTPDAPAVVLGDQALTYVELERGANRLAHHLRRLGVGPEVRVGLLVERSTDLLVALLGVLKAGGAYIPLDPVAPPERQRALLADAGAPVLLTQANLAARLEGYPGAVVRLDEDHDIVAREPDDAPAAGVHPRNLAYVLYTSGSTGAPKGVLVEHRSVLNLFAALQEAVYSRRGAAAPPRVTMNGPVFFDTSVKQWVQLLGGAALCVVPEETRADARALVAYLRRHDVEVLDCTPSQLRVLLSEGLLEDGARLTDLLVAGEALERDLWATLAAAEGRRAWNLYGPTECTVDAALGQARGERPTIGRPVANARLYVLDPAGRPTPYGVPGELFVGGEGVARGYLGQPALTAEKFVPDSFGSEAGGRLYRTGDRVRWLANGELEYLGRMDQQLKLRGFRIEPGEIEAALLESGLVREAAVVAREDSPGRQRLVAYVVAAEGAEVATPVLREHLSSHLPEYMVPAAYVVLERLPLNRNGKLDRRALPAPEHGTALDAYTAPRTPAEEVLAEIWAEVLKTERVGALDNFFELGGHSLLATQVISRLRDAFGVEVPLKALFEAPTVAGLAGRIEALRSTGATPAPPIVPVERTGPLPLSFAQQRLWLVDRIEPDSAAYNMPFPLRLRGGLDLRVLRASLDALVRRHEPLRTVFPEEGGRPVQVVRPPRPVPLPMVDLRGLPGEARQAEAKRLSGAEAVRPFDLAAGPLLRGTLVRLDEEDHVLLFNLHHIVSDGWSMQVLVREVSVFYAAFARGEPADLPELPVQYADFAVWQREWLSGEVLEAQIGFWRERLEGAPPLLEIPTDRPRRAGQSPLAAMHDFTLPPELSRRLRELARREGATLFMTLLAGWQALLSRYSGQDDVVVGTPIAGRNRRETEG
ncbi:MAG: amino acid adenylation domain-containing protein, partial [Gemmatimonadota bacterium]